MPDNATVADVCKALANARSDAALLTGTSGGGAGGMAGIVTAIDLTRYALAWMGPSSPLRFVPPSKKSSLFLVAGRFMIPCPHVPVRMCRFMFTVSCLPFHVHMCRFMFAVSRFSFHF